MPNPYFQVARTYLQRTVWLFERHPLISMASVVLTIIFLPIIFLKNLPSAILLLFVFLFIYLATHVKEQFINDRSSLIPYFRKVHGVVATIVAIVFVILLPVLISLLTSWQTIGLVSITIFLFGIILWTILRLGITFDLLVIVGLISFLKPIRNGIENIVSGNKPIQAFIFLGIGAVLSIAGIIRLLLLNEEKREYNLNINSPIEDSWAWGRWFANGNVVRMIYHAIHATDSSWSRIQRWNCSGSSFCYAFLGATYYNLLFILGYSVTNGIYLPRIRIFLATLIPLLLANKLIIEKKIPFIAQDLMLPIKRDAYLKQVGMSFATSLFIQWGVFMTVTILLMLPSVLRPTPEFLIISISYSLMIQIWLFGLIIWSSSFHYSSMHLWGIPAFLLLLISFRIVLDPKVISIPWLPIILGVLFVCHGLFLTWRGYRRWIVADLN